MYDLFNWIDILAKFAFVVVVFGGGGWYVYQWWQNTLPERDHRRTKATLNGAGTFRHDDEVHPSEAAQANLSFMGIPSVTAGWVLQMIPQLDKGSAKGETDGIVITTARGIAYTRQGPDPIDLIELDKYRLLISSGGRAAILFRHDLTDLETQYLQDQRQDAVERGDGIIESFLGHQWTIRGAYGKNMVPKSGERECSYIQVFSSHPKLGTEEPGIATAFAPGLFDLEMHDYYDLRAICAETGQYLYAFYTAGQWCCYIGRVLDADEAQKIAAL